MSTIDKKRQHWLDADDNEVYAGELRTAAAVYIAELEAQVETLKVCGNCSHFMRDAEYQSCDVSRPGCVDPEYVSAWNPCELEPSRWEKGER